MKRTNILLCFCKHPVPGLVKSRLAKTIGNSQACETYKKLLKYTLETATKTSLKTYLYCYPDIHHQFLEQCSNEYPVFLKQQSDGNLGKKMFMAINSHLTIDASNIVLIGSDCLEIDENYISQAFEYLDNGYDIVVGPAQDGGYALIGANKISESVFDNIEWSTSKVLTKTISNISHLDWKYKCLSEVRDLDTIDDYMHFTSSEKYKNVFS